MKTVIIVAPSLDAAHNVSGVSAVADFIISHNKQCEYVHFLQGKPNEEKGLLIRLNRIRTNYRRWSEILEQYPHAIVHFNFPIDAKSITRDYSFMRLAYKKKMRMVIHLHGGMYLFKKHIPFIFKLALKKIFGWNTTFIVLSNKEKSKIESYEGSKKVFVLPNCVNLSEAANYRREDNGNKLDILYLGRIEPNKGIDYILNAAKVLLDKGVDFIVHFAGVESKGMGYISKFQQVLGDRFVYEGVVSGDYKVELLKKCNVFLLPSFFEGLPMSLLECMSFGMIPVTTNVGSISDFVVDNETGLIVQKKDTDSIVKALQRLSDSSDLRNKLSKCARDKIFTTLDPQKYVSTLNEIYESTDTCV